MEATPYITSNLFSVKDKTCIVTGAGTGIGKGIACALAVNGAKVVICGRRKDVIESAAKEMNAAAVDSGMGGELIAFQADIGRKSGVTAFYEDTCKVIDKVDFLVCNAGSSRNWRNNTAMDARDTLADKLMSIEDSDWASMTAVHVASPYYLSVIFVPLFSKAQSPSLCYITSLSATFLQRACCEFSYAQSKAAEAHLCQLMAGTLQPYGIRVNSVEPGLFPSELTVDSQGKLYPPMQAATQIIPASRPGTLEEIAGPVLMLASPAGAYMNGANIRIDGGWNINASARDV